MAIDRCVADRTQAVVGTLGSFFGELKFNYAKLPSASVAGTAPQDESSCDRIRVRTSQKSTDRQSHKTHSPLEVDA
jgi:hypothetical protein